MKTSVRISPPRSPWVCFSLRSLHTAGFAGTRWRGGCRNILSRFVRKTQVAVSLIWARQHPARAQEWVTSRGNPSSGY